VPPDHAIFISYRRKDSEPATHGITERLRAAFGERAVFRDVHAVPGGAEWRAEIEGAIGACLAFVVVIGEDWLSIAGAGGRRRLEEDDDPVRFELEAAFARPGLKVIPVTVGAARVPAERDIAALSDGLSGLLKRLLAVPRAGSASTSASSRTCCS
jgi:hypothetical protein